MKPLSIGNDVYIDSNTIFCIAIKSAENEKER